MSEHAQRVERALADIEAGKFVILVDDEDRENEGDLVIAAEKITADAVNFMAVEARGLICLAMTGDLLDRLDIPMMVSTNDSPYGTAFTVSIEARDGVTTGISAADRARTIEVAVADGSTPDDIVMPGHIFPLRARDGGVLVRTGQTEGSVDLSRLAGLKSAAVICEIMNADGTMARMPELEVFAEEHELMILSVADLIQYRLERESLVRLLDDRPLPTEWPGEWRVQVYSGGIDGTQHFCLVCGEPTPDEPTLVRVQHRIDTFGLFTETDPEPQQKLRGSMKAIGEKGCGVIVYLDRQQLSAIEMVRKHISEEAGNRHDSDSNAPAHHDEDVNRPKEALRDLGIGAQILRQAGVGRMLVLTNRPKNIIGTEAYGLEVVEQVPIPSV
jgi:3,4-dihydroxy 2-butanone 4-phosphate synthase/GTP cyclohydrolase II